MKCNVYLAPKFDGEAVARPVYRIDGNYYDVTTLKPSHYAKWEHEALFGIPVELDREWTTSPILVETTCGGVVIEAMEDGRIALGIPSTKRALESPILQLYPMLLPKLSSPKRGKNYTARSLPPPDPIGCAILEGLVRFGLTLNEYLGRSGVQEGGSKVEFETIIKMWEQRHIRRINRIPEFKEPARYQESNVIILVTDTACNISGTIGRFLHHKEKYEEPLAMIVAKI